MSRIPIVDTHQHLWDLSKFRLPWTSNVAALNKSFLMSDYLKATKGLNIAKTVYMEVDLHPSQQDAEAEFVIATCKKDDNPMAAGVISGRPNSEGFAGYITKYKDSRYIKGVRQVLHVPSAKAGFCLQKQFIASVRLLGELGMSYDICIRPEELTDAAKLVSHCPDTRLILDHCGNRRPGGPHGDRWRRDLAVVARYKNVVCKVSGIVDKAGDRWKPEDLAPVVNHTLETFGPDRVMFGGDWPVCTLKASFRDWASALHEIVADRSLEDRRKLFHDNAVRFYGLG